MSLPETASELLVTMAEPTRLRILNCLAAAPLFVSDLQSLLDLPQPTVSRHLQVLRRSELVRDTPIAQFVLYRLRRVGGPQGRLLGAILDAGLEERQVVVFDRLDEPTGPRTPTSRPPLSKGTAIWLPDVARPGRGISVSSRAASGLSRKASRMARP